MKDEPAAVRHFERAADGYSRLRGSALVGWLRRRETEAVRALTGVAPGDRVLDAGCGDGATLAWLNGCGASAVGIDIAWGMLRQCRRCGFAVVRHDLDGLALRSSFDWVLCLGSLEFVANPARTLAGLAACLRPAGRLVLLFPRRGWMGRLYAAYHRSHGVAVRLFGREEVVALLRSSGLAEPHGWRDGPLSSACVALREETSPRVHS